MALHHGLSDKLKDILSIQDLPEDWSSYIMLMKKCDMQYCVFKVKSHRSSAQNKSTSMLAPRNASPVSAQPTPHLTSSGSSLLTGGSPMTGGRVTQDFRKEKMRTNNSNDGNYLLLWGFF
jgi:hypothetical protein